jgi:hypothetical protein
LRRVGGYRLSMNNPPAGDDLVALPAKDWRRPYGELAALFLRLADPDKLQVKYVSRELLPKFDVMFAHPKTEVRAVWAKGGDIRVLVGERQMWPQHWRVLRNGKLGAEIEPPNAYALTPKTQNLDSRKGTRQSPVPADFLANPCEPWQVRWGTKVIYGGRFHEKSGTWAFENGKKPERLFDEAISYQLVTPYGHGLVGTADKKLVCFDLSKRKMVPIKNSESAGPFYALDNLPGGRQVLLVQPAEAKPVCPRLSREAYSPPATYRLLYPASGTITKIEYMDGWAQWREPMSHSFQSAEEPGLVWMAFGKGMGRGTLGLFDTHTFEFRNWVSVDTFEFDNDHVWIDESAKKFYVIYRGQLLQFPLPKDVFEYPRTRRR